MAMSSVTVRVDDDIKNQAAKIADDFGFDLSSVTRAFYKQMVREQRIPLTLSYPEPNDESAQSIKEADAIIAKGEPGYGNASEMFDAIGV